MLKYIQEIKQESFSYNKEKVVFKSIFLFLLLVTKKHQYFGHTLKNSVEMGIIHRTRLPMEAPMPCVCRKILVDEIDWRTVKGMARVETTFLLHTPKRIDRLCLIHQHEHFISYRGLCQRVSGNVAEKFADRPRVWELRMCYGPRNLWNRIHRFIHMW